MARLHEYQGKDLLRKFGIAVPDGAAVSTPEEAREQAERLGGRCVVKAQAWITSRAAQGAIRFVETSEEAARAATQMLGQSFAGFAVERVLVEQRLSLKRELFLSILVDDEARRPLLLLAGVGGSGIEEILQSHPERVGRATFSAVRGLRGHEARSAARKAGLSGKMLGAVGAVAEKAARLFLACECRSLEINPLVVTEEGAIVALDCRIAIDDYAVFRHPELGIEIARELSRPPTRLDRIAYDAEKNDYRGTFYFIELETERKEGVRYVGFHGAGGGGSMMSMDALKSEGFEPANFTDTSGNPPASKVYRAARVILAQKGIVGYFGSGSGVASQEQDNQARGLVKAFLEAPLEVPAVVRLGGNREDEAVAILEGYTQSLPVPVEGYKSKDPASKCAARLRELVEHPAAWRPAQPLPTRSEPHPTYSFPTVTGGTVAFDDELCLRCPDQPCVPACKPQILSVRDGTVRLNISLEEARSGKCIECFACEQECFFHAQGAIRITMPIPGLAEYVACRS
jgi:succinyl-CoA synthetase beta subunit